MLSIDKNKQADLVRKLSILFVEDDAEVRDSMARYLSRRVDRVHTAHNGLAGLSSFKEMTPDLVISDIRMGGMDGLAMCRAIRETRPEIPLIIISAHNESDVLLSSIDIGITKFIVKPVDTGVLMDAINGVAQSIEAQRNLENRLQKMDSILSETDYESESVRNYVARYLDANHHDEISNVRHLNIPKLGVSGDFYSVARHDDDLYVMLADGAGHGLSAVIPALQMPKIFQQQAARGFSLLTIAAEINRYLHDQNFVEHFVATTLVRANPGENFIEILNCGNPPVFVFDENGVLLHTCHSKSTALGMVGDEEFTAEVERFRMDKNARIYLFTDGLSDSLQAANPDFCHDDLSGVFGNQPATNVFDAVSKMVGQLAQRSSVDDISLLEIYFDCKSHAARQVEMPLEPEPQGEAEAPVALDQMTLLYVEDDELTRDYLALYLNRRLGMVYVAKDGREGLALFKKHRPQIVLSDIKMPYMTGLEMAEEIRKQDKEVPIIVTSGSDNAEDAERMFEMGISRFHLKPLDPGKLTNTIQSCIRQANSLNRLRLSASAFQASSLAVITADRSKRIVAVNPAFTQLTGYTLAEMIGHSPTLLGAGKHEASHYLAMWHALDESGGWSGELLCQHKNGATVSEWLTVNAVKGADGVATGYHFIFSDNSERQVNEEKVRQQALHDTLTRLPNRAMFAEMFDGMLAKAEALNGSVALVHINIDRFTEINNLLGVHVGDAVLSEVAQRLMGHIGEADVACRMGGDEFAILMLNDGKRESVEQLVVGLSSAIKQPIVTDEHEVQVNVSIGISLYPADGASYEALVKSAGNALNQAHRMGGDTYRFFDPTVSRQEERQLALQRGLRPGLQKHDFFMVYQPKYSLSRQRVVGAEALVRWNHAELGLVSPAEFIPLVESSGGVIELSEWIIDTVCSQLSAWRRQGLPQVPVSINISPLHFWRGDLVGALQSGLQKWALSPEMLPIEVTEGVVMDTSARTLQVLAELKALGFHLSIDDFGTGYSSLKYLKDLPISELKIDRSFIVEIPEEGQLDDLSRTAIPRAIIQLASELKLTVVAEGVETESQKNFLLENGCDVIQGFLFSKPVSPEKFSLLLV